MGCVQKTLIPHKEGIPEDSGVGTLRSRVSFAQNAFNTFLPGSIGTNKNF